MNDRIFNCSIDQSYASEMMITRSDHK